MTNKKSKRVKFTFDQGNPSSLENMTEEGHSVHWASVGFKVKRLKLPSFTDAEMRVKAKRATPLDQFVYDNEPCQPDEEGFRDGLQAVVDYVLTFADFADINQPSESG